MNCVKHPNTETFIRCAKCDAPICTDCMVTGPVGIRCRKCARGPVTPLFQPKPVGLLRAAGSGIAAAVLLGWVVKITILIGAPVLGVVIGELVLRAGGRKRGRLMEYAAGGSAALGVLLWSVPWFVIFSTGLIGLIGYLINPYGALLTLVGVALAVVCAVGRIRYL